MDRSPEQRARDGRLAWILVGSSAVATCLIIGVLVHALSGSIAQLADATAQPPVVAPPAPLAEDAAAESPDMAVVAPAAMGQLQKRSGSTAASPARRADRGATSGEVRKLGARAEDEIAKSQGGEQETEGSADRDTPGETSEPDDLRDPGRRI